MKPLRGRIREANKLLSAYAVKHPSASRQARGEQGLGRVYDEPEDETRFPFQRDRDRIIHCQSFRRLKYKTQVFVAGSGDLSRRSPEGAKTDHYRTRLTHTMEVAQISRDMARTLELNEDLTECIALAHDLGHPPFAHAGEEALDQCMREHGLHFEHNEQSLRIVTLLETRCSAYPGLNLNREVLEGLKKHQTTFDLPFSSSLLAGRSLGEDWSRGASRRSLDKLGTARRKPSLEAQIVNLADEIAYTAHDVDDGLRAGLLSLERLRGSSLFRDAEGRTTKHGTEVRGSLIHLLITDVYRGAEIRPPSMCHTEQRRSVVPRSGTMLRPLDSARGKHAQHDTLAFSNKTTKELADLRAILMNDLYNSDAVRNPAEQGKSIVKKLFQTFLKNPPEKVLELQKRTGSDLPIAVCDYISGMTDPFAAEAVKEIPDHRFQIPKKSQIPTPSSQ